MTKLKAQFRHDCDQCVLLSVTDDEDWYFCPNSDGGSGIRRVGDEPSDYLSVPYAVWTRAYRAGEDLAWDALFGLARAENLVRTPSYEAAIQKMTDILYTLAAHDRKWVIDTLARRFT